jgi:hypothetical protein
LRPGRQRRCTDAIDRFARDETLEELVAAIERDITANKPAAALDRLHTYCMKKFAHLLESYRVSCDRKEPLHARVGILCATHRARSLKTQSPSSRNSTTSETTIRSRTTTSYLTPQRLDSSSIQSLQFLGSSKALKLRVSGPKMEYHHPAPVSQQAEPLR